MATTSSTQYTAAPPIQSYTDSTSLSRSLLPESPRSDSFARRRGTSVTGGPRLGANAREARKRLRSVAVRTITQQKAERAVDPGRPSLKVAEEYMRFFLPKTPDGKLLSLTCSEAEFSEHVGSGVSLYFHFIKMTGWLFVLATLVALPQFYGNANGDGLQLEWPFTDPNKNSMSRSNNVPLMRSAGALAQVIFMIIFGIVAMSVQAAPMAMRADKDKVKDMGKPPDQIGIPTEK
eukprot:gene9833-3408_t